MEQSQILTVIPDAYTRDQRWGLHPSRQRLPDLLTARSGQIEMEDRGPTFFITQSDPRRTTAIDLIQRVYAEHYAAAPTAFPSVMAGRRSADGTLKAACGLRFAADGFFSRNYLHDDVASVISSTYGQPVASGAVLEVTTLASESRLDGVALVSDVIFAAVRTGVVFGCFTATRKLAEYLVRRGLPLIYVARAEARMVPDSRTWGRYYEFDPAVYVVDARPAAALVGILLSNSESTI